jgi:hypothetical protein
MAGFMFEESGGVCYGMSDPNNPTKSDGIAACSNYYSSSLNLDWNVWCKKQTFIKVCISKVKMLRFEN